MKIRPHDESTHTVTDDIHLPFHKCQVTAYSVKKQHQPHGESQTKHTITLRFRCLYAVEIASRSAVSVVLLQTLCRHAIDNQPHSGTLIFLQQSTDLPPIVTKPKQRCAFNVSNCFELVNQAMEVVCQLVLQRIHINAITSKSTIEDGLQRSHGSHSIMK